MVLNAGKSQIKVSANPVPSEGSLPDLYTAAFSMYPQMDRGDERKKGEREREVEREREREMFSASYKDINPIMGFTLMTSFPKESPTSKYHHIRISMNLRWTQIFSQYQSYNNNRNSAYYVLELCLVLYIHYLI